MSSTLPIWLVVGFLGAGKTTLLQRLARSVRGRGLVYVVNEFSAVDVDAAVIEREGVRTVAVPGGSIFCRCLVTEFVKVLRSVVEGDVSNAEPSFRPEGVVIEASGLADPRSLRRLLAESRLDARYHVAGIVAVVDPGSVMKLLLVLPNIRGQIESADLILLNKTDLHTAETVEKVKRKIREINLSATLIRCMRSEVDAEIVLADGVSRRVDEVDAAFGLCKDPCFEREVVVFPHPVDGHALGARLAALGDGLYRAKGFVLTTDGWTYIDWSAGVLSVSDSDSSAASALALIWNPEAVQADQIAQIRMSVGGPAGVRGV